MVSWIGRFERRHEKTLDKCCHLESSKKLEVGRDTKWFQLTDRPSDKRQVTLGALETGALTANQSCAADAVRKVRGVDETQHRWTSPGRRCCLFVSFSPWNTPIFAYVCYNVLQPRASWACSLVLWFRRALCAFPLRGRTEVQPVSEKNTGMNQARTWDLTWPGLEVGNHFLSKWRWHSTTLKIGTCSKQISKVD